MGTWVTRRGVHVDRIACAWLIRRFIDPKAGFKFVSVKRTSGRGIYQSRKLRRDEIRKPALARAGGHRDIRFIDHPMMMAPAGVRRSD
jgi:chromate resistance exported protein